MRLTRTSKIITFAAILFLAFSAHGQTQKKQFDFQTQIGIVDRKPTDNMVCMGIQNANLAVGSQVVVVSMAEEQQRALMATVQKKLTDHCSEGIWTSADENTFYYSLTITNGKTLDFIGIALINPINAPKVNRGLVGIDVNNDQTFERFRECTSNEGLHLTVWSGRPLKSKRLWHKYYYLKYDTEPTCTDAEAGN